MRSVSTTGPIRPSDLLPSNVERPDAAAFDLRLVLAALARRKWVVFGVAAVVTVAAVVLTAREVRTYVATAMVRLSNVRQLMTSGVTDAQGGAGRGDLRLDPFASELLVLRGREVATQVVDRLGLRLIGQRPGQLPAFLDSVRVDLPDTETRVLTIQSGSNGVIVRMAGATRRASYGSRVNIGGVSFVVRRPVGPQPVTLRVIPEQTARSLVISGISARLRPGTDVLDISFIAADRGYARLAVNEVVDAYSRVSTAMVQSVARRRREFLQEQVRETERGVLAAQAALANYRSQKQVYNSTQRVAAEQAAVFELESRRVELASELDAFRKILAPLEKRPAPDGPELRAVLAIPLGATSAYTTALASSLSRSLATHDSLLAVGLLETHTDIRRIDELMAATLARFTDAIRSQIVSLEARLAAVDQMRDRSAGSLERLAPTEAEETRLAEQAQAMRGLWDHLRMEYQRARIAEAVEVGQVEIVDYASGAVAVSRRRPMKVGLGAAIGLLLGMALALALDRRRTAIRSRDELEQGLRVPALAVIRKIPTISSRTTRWRVGPAVRRQTIPLAKPKRVDGGSSVSDLVVTARPGVLEAEAYRAIRTRLMFARGQRPLRTLVVTSAASQDGKSVSAANLAVAFAEQGLSVLLIDCDLRRPSLHEIFGMKREPGLTDLLMQSARPEEAIRVTQVERLSVLTSGAMTSNPTELLGGGRMSTLLDWLVEQYDFVLMDSPPLLACADPAVLAARADGVLLVVRAGRTTPAMATEAIAQVVAVGGRIVGAVLNDPDGQADRDENAAYTYKYAYPA
jgi:capsular exopolysaccharide synthesis family protein